MKHPRWMDWFIANAVATMSGTRLVSSRDTRWETEYYIFLSLLPGASHVTTVRSLTGSLICKTMFL